MIKAAVFDFDGVILESSDIKTRAFAELFADRPDHVDEIVALHLELEGVSRYEKFRRIYDEIFDEPLNEQELRRLGDRFSEIVWKQMMQCPFVPGARELLDSRSSSHRLFVASGTPEEELREIVARRRIADRFAAVYGTPPTKAEILARILGDEGLEPEHLLFVGDATTDLEGARAAGVPFVGRVRDDGRDPFSGAGVATVADLAELDGSWERLIAQPPNPPR